MNFVQVWGFRGKIFTSNSGQLHFEIYFYGLSSIDLISHSTYVVCGIYSGGTFHGNFFTLRVPEIYGEEIAEEILFVFCFDIWSGLEPWLFVNYVCVLSSVRTQCSTWIGIIFWVLKLLRKICHSQRFLAVSINLWKQMYLSWFERTFLS